MSPSCWCKAEHATNPAPSAWHIKACNASRPSAQNAKRRSLRLAAIRRKITFSRKKVQSFVVVSYSQKGHECTFGRSKQISLLKIRQSRHPDHDGSYLNIQKHLTRGSVDVDLPCNMDDTDGFQGETGRIKEAHDLARAYEDEIFRKIREKIKCGPLKNFSDECDKVLDSYTQRIVSGCVANEEGMAKNLFELVGATKLIRANLLSRVVSTQLGAAWEEIAALSHLAVSPEHDLGIRIIGVDLIFVEAGKLRHTQIKTQKNMLTGSQKGRSISELQVYPHPLFAAAFDVANWTFPPCGIERVAGRQFWSKLALDYDSVIAAARRCLISLESRLFA